MEVYNWSLASPLKSVMREGRCGTASSHMCPQ
jgi:hypothetical protein